MNAAQDAAAPSAAGGAAAAQQQQQPQSFLSRLGGIVMQLIFIQVVMQLVGSFTSPRVQQQQQQMPEQSLDMRAGGAAAGAGHAAATAGAGGGMLQPALNESPFLNLHPNAVLLNAFPPDTPFDVFLHLKYITVLEPSSRRRAAAAAWGPATVESDRLFYSQFFLPSETSATVSSPATAGGGAAAASVKSEDAAGAAEGSTSKGGESSSSSSGGLSGAWSNVLGSLRQLSPGAHATAAAGSSVENSGSRNLFPRVPLGALWLSSSSSSTAAAAARPKEVASIRLVLPPAAAVGSRAQTASSEQRQQEEETSPHTTPTEETGDAAQRDADERRRPLEEQQEIVYWGGNAVLLWQLLNQKYTYDRWSSSKEQVVSIQPPADFFLQFPRPADAHEDAATAKQQQQQQHETLQQQQHQTLQQQEREKTQQQEREKTQEQQKTPQQQQETQQQQRGGREEAERTLQKERQKEAEEELPEELKMEREELSKRKKRTMLCLVTTVVPHSAYVNGRPERLDTERAPEVDEQQVLQRITSLMQPMPLLLPREEEEHSLLLGGEGEEKRRALERQALASPVVWHLKNRVDVSLVFDSSQHTPQNLRLGPMQNVKVRPLEATYEPVIYHSDFWLLEKNFIPLNETLVDKPLNLTLSFGVGSLHGWLVQEQLGAAIEQQQKMGLQSTREAMMFKRILIETNPFMLAFSTAFILLHSVFSFFAFKNDMQFWYRNDSMEGLSALSLIFNFVCEVIIGLYLFDSGDTSWLILFEICLGIVLSAWKVTKAMRVKLSRTLPYVSVEFRKSYSDSNTKELDSVAIKWMSLILAPCVLGYAVYALIHNKYRSWYSYFISVLAGSVYTFGFITMTPQLYINYKLKSVDHLPWRALVYRSLNTFVDDVASFLIDMPWMHRLSCFRDDIIFICYLYQRWIYKVDETRVMGAPPAAGAAGPQQLHRDEDLLRQAGSEGQTAAEREQLSDKSSEGTTLAAASRSATNSGTAAMTCAAAPPVVAACRRRETSVHKGEDDTAAGLTQRIRQPQSEGAGDD